MKTCDPISPFEPARPRTGAFTLMETMMAMAISVVTLVGLFAAVGQAIRIVRSGKEIASASQMLQQRVETLRFARLWKDITTSTGVTGLVSAGAAVSGNFRNATETFSVTPYPAGGTPLVVTRTPAGGLSTTGADLTAQRCVKFTINVAWTGVGNIQRTRQMSTIITKGGL